MNAHGHLPQLRGFDMTQMRTIDQAYTWLQERDADTAVTKTALRRLVTTGQLPAVRVGSKYLVNLEVLEAFLSGTNIIPFTPPERWEAAR